MSMDFILDRIYEYGGEAIC